MNKILSDVIKLLKDDKAQGMAEYALVLFLIAVVCIGTITTVGKNVSTKLKDIGSQILNAK